MTTTVRQAAVQCINTLELSYQKSKTPRTRQVRGVLARREGFEPPAFWSVARRSIQLS